ALIPRPESETIITIASDIISSKLSSSTEKIKLIDVGTGTGCLGITLQLEHPDIDVTLIDNSLHALNLAKENAVLLKASVHPIKNNLLSDLTTPTDIIIANLPYVDKSWTVSPDTQFEPDEALYASNGGLFLIFRLLDQATLTLKPGGYILIESDPRQQNDIITHAQSIRFTHIKTEGYVTVFSYSTN
ncbi:HemK family protein methyltransferase, partial [Candidatus Saccharibacteria bacterium]|nr:HemK family protein methyltransferase [Candidatus Saccharibacteria bacterium]